MNEFQEPKKIHDRYQNSFNNEKEYVPKPSPDLRNIQEFAEDPSNPYRQDLHRYSDEEPEDTHQAYDYYRNDPSFDTKNHYGSYQEDKDEHSYFQGDPTRQSKYSERSRLGEEDYYSQPKPGNSEHYSAHDIYPGRYKQEQSEDEYQVENSDDEYGTENFTGKDNYQGQNTKVSGRFYYENDSERDYTHSKQDYAPHDDEGDYEQYDSDRDEDQDDFQKDYHQYHPQKEHHQYHPQKEHYQYHSDKEHYQYHPEKEHYQYHPEKEHHQYHPEKEHHQYYSEKEHHQYYSEKEYHLYESEKPEYSETDNSKYKYKVPYEEYKDETPYQGYSNQFSRKEKPGTYKQRAETTDYPEEVRGSKYSSHYLNEEPYMPKDHDPEYSENSEEEEERLKEISSNFQAVYYGEQPPSFNVETSHFKYEEDPYDPYPEEHTEEKIHIEVTSPGEMNYASNERKDELPEQKHNKPPLPEDNPQLLIFENESARQQKMRKWTAKKEKRLEELQERAKHTPSPRHVSPKPQSQESSTRPTVHRETKKNTNIFHETKEDISHKYRRHKNLPNLVYNKPSNKKIIKNAIEYVCIAGEPNKHYREEVLKVIDSCEDVSYMIIVFKSELGRRDFKALYSHEVNTGEVKKIHGPSVLPDVLIPEMVKIFFRYDSGAKVFKVLQCKEFITGTDAIVLHPKPKNYIP